MTADTPTRPPLADALRRIEDAFVEEGHREPSPHRGEGREGGRTELGASGADALDPDSPLPQPPPQGEGEKPAPSADALRAAEAVLFAGGAPVTAAVLAEKLGPDMDVAAVLMRLKRDYAGRGVELVEAGGAWRFQSAPDLAGLFSETKETPKRLPKSALETLAVIAYHQPVTRAEIEDIRGVSLSRGAMELLLELGWIRPRGRRRTPGRPLTFGTTDAFLAHFGLASLDALPGKDDLKGLGLLDARAAAELDVPRPSDGQGGDDQASDEEPLGPGEDIADFFVDHLDETE